MSDASLSLRDGTPPPSDEQRIARAVAVGLPILTVAVAAVVGLVIGPATSILVLAAGLLLGVIAILWTSLRILSGDATLSPELEALDMAAQGVDALASRKKMLLRALKDLDNERSIGKLEDEDYEQISSTYRAELKAVLKRIDESLAPHRARAEEALRSHLVRAGIGEAAARGKLPADDGGSDEPARAPEAGAKAKDREADGDARVACPKCGESNEPDAKFCKECATRLSPASTSKEPAKLATSTDDSEDDEDDDDE
ncbi:MAG: zinc ribbon domain-containing protein [Labilithrix sp.]|nr:zinc ribbon domain-containing protein [Labilithrix sp.]